MRWLSSIFVLSTALLASAVASATPPSARPVAFALLPSGPFDVQTLHALNELTRNMSSRGKLGPHDAPTLKLRRIVLDPGHGGSNHGASGVAEVDEKVLTLNLAYAVRDALRVRYPGTEVLLTRYWDRDVELDDRIAWANEVGADLFLSLHYNAATHDRALGYETFYLAEELLMERVQPGRRKMASRPQQRAGTMCDRARVAAHAATQLALAAPHVESKRLAEAVQQQLASNLSSVNRGVKQANFAVLRGAKMPAVVVEAGFLTHPIEGVDLLQRPHRDAVVQALVDAVGEFDRASPDPTPKFARSAAEHLVVEARRLASSTSVAVVEPLQRRGAQDPQIVDALLVR